MRSCFFYAEIGNGFLYVFPGSNFARGLQRSRRLSFLIRLFFSKHVSYRAFPIFLSYNDTSLYLGSGMVHLPHLLSQEEEFIGKTREVNKILECQFCDFDLFGVPSSADQLVPNIRA
jgi:hypothetical protein